jgi:hypothetical protein
MSAVYPLAFSQVSRAILSNETQAAFVEPKPTSSWYRSTRFLKCGETRNISGTFGSLIYANTLIPRYTVSKIIATPSPMIPAAENNSSISTYPTFFSSIGVINEAATTKRTTDTGSNRIRKAISYPNGDSDQNSESKRKKIAPSGYPSLRVHVAFRGQPEQASSLACYCEACPNRAEMLPWAGDHPA